MGRIGKPYDELTDAERRRRDGRAKVSGFVWAAIIVVVAIAAFALNSWVKSNHPEWAPWYG